MGSLSYVHNKQYAVVKDLRYGKFEFIIMYPPCFTGMMEFCINLIEEEDQPLFHSALP